MNEYDIDAVEFDKINTANLKPPGAASQRIGPRDIIYNLISSLLLLLIACIANGFMQGEFNYEQILGWNMGVLVLVNWACGIGFSYTLRQIGIRMGVSTPEYIKAESDKQESFSKIKDYTSAQQALDEKIENDFTYRRETLERNIAKLVQPRLSEVEEWKQGKPLPKNTSLKVRAMSWYLNHMTPPQISLIQMAEAETSVVPKSLFDIPADPTATGAKWFIKKGAGKLFFFAAVPILLSLIASALLGEVTFASFITIAGTLAAMLFNGAMSITTSYYAVVRAGVNRLRRITRIINLLI